MNSQNSSFKTNTPYTSNYSWNYIIGFKVKHGQNNCVEFTSQYIKYDWSTVHVTTRRQDNIITKTALDDPTLSAYTIWYLHKQKFCFILLLDIIL